MRNRTRIIGLTAFAACALWIANPQTSMAATKDIKVTLDKKYLNCEFIITADAPEGEMYTYEIFPPNANSGINLQPSADGVVRYTTEEAAGGDWIVRVDNHRPDEVDEEGNTVTHPIGKVSVKMNAGSGASEETEKQRIEVAKEIAGLRTYYKDDSVVVCWTDDTVGKVNVTVTDTKTLYTIYTGTVNGKEIEVPIPNTTEEITITAVPSISQSVEGAGQQFTKKVINDPDATVILPVMEYTNHSEYGYTVELRKAYALAYYVNGKYVGGEDKHEPGTYDFAVPLQEGNCDIFVYVVDDEGNMRSTSTTTILDTIPPVLYIETDYNGASTTADHVEFVGKVEDYSEITFNNQEFEPDYDGQFKVGSELEVGVNRFQILAMDLAGNQTAYTAEITRVVETKEPFPWAKLGIGAGIITCIIILFVLKRKSTLEHEVDPEETFSWRDMFHRPNFGPNKGLVIDILYVLVPVVSVWLIVHYVLIFGVCESGSMEPTIMTGNLTMTNGVAYLARNPERGDIIAFRNDQTNGQVFVKRIIGMPGEHIEFKNGNVYINGLCCEEEYIGEDVETNCDKVFDVPSDEYFVMGDNRENSADSRYWTNPYVNLSDIKGRVFADFDIMALLEMFGV